jgi:uncharacterized Zn finger protein
MVSEFDLPCTECGGDLTRSVVQSTGGNVAVAECPDCGTRHYPELALSALQSVTEDLDSDRDSVV